MAAPASTYAELMRHPARISALAALRRPLLVAVIVGSSTAMLATRHATPALVFSTTVCWSVLVAAQIAIALSVIAGPARRTIGVARALDLFFAGHAPWSLWLLAVVAYAPTSFELRLTPILLLALIPIALTPRIIAAYFREVLGLGRREALARTALHQAITWLALAIVYGAAVAIIPRIVEWVS